MSGKDADGQCGPEASAFFFCCHGLLDVCGLPMLPSQHHQRVTAAAVKWSMPLLLREYFPSGPLPNASDHCFCPHLPVWGLSKTLPRYPSPKAGGRTVAHPQHRLSHQAYLGMDTWLPPFHRHSVNSSLLSLLLLTFLRANLVSDSAGCEAASHFPPGHQVAGVSP